MLRPSSYIVALTACALALAACSSSGSTGPNYQLIGGTYTATLTYTIENNDYDSTFVIPGTIDMLDANRVGEFTGTWHITGTGADTATGVIIGAFVADTIQWLQFGDADEKPLISQTLLAQLVPQCHVLNGSPLVPASGTIVGKQLNISGTFSGFTCGTGADTVSSTLAATVTATNTTGPN